MPWFMLNCIRTIFVMVCIHSLFRFGKFPYIEFVQTWQVYWHKHLFTYSDPVTYKPFNGVEAGDIGAKCGWNGIDNG